MNPLGSDTKALLDAARHGDDPTTADRSRVRARIAARIAMGVAAGTAVTTAAKSAAGTAAAAGGGGAAAIGAAGATAVAGSALSVGVGMKLLLAMAVAGAVGMGTISYVEQSRSEAPAPVGSMLTTTARGTGKAVASSPARLVAGPAWPAAAQIATATASPTSTPSSPPAPPSHATTAPAPTASVSAEVSLLQDAQTALASGDAGRALALLDEHARRFPSGALGEERDAERIFALCALGRAGDARAWAAHFLGVYPRSLYVSRIKSSCAASVP